MMISEHDKIRSGMYRRMGIDTSPKRKGVDVDIEIRQMSRKLEEIANIAKPRLIMGGIRYGSKWEHVPLMKYMQSKFDTYKKTGNFEMLIDLFNFVVIEGQLKTHPNHHFHAVDRKD